MWQRLPFLLEPDCARATEVNIGQFHVLNRTCRVHAAQLYNFTCGWKSASCLGATVFRPQKIGPEATLMMFREIAVAKRAKINKLMPVEQPSKAYRSTPLLPPLAHPLAGAIHFEADEIGGLVPTATPLVLFVVESLSQTASLAPSRRRRSSKSPFTSIVP